MTDLLNTNQVSDNTGIPVGTLRAYRSRGIGPRWFKIGRKAMYKTADVHQWIEEQYETTGTAKNND